jgi:hypothetical protein
LEGVLVAKQRTSAASETSFFANAFSLLKQTGQEFLQDKAPQLGAALAYYTVFSLAPLILVLLAIVGAIYREDPASAWNKITQQMSYFLDPSAIQVVQDIARKASQPGKSTIATCHWRCACTFRRKRCFRSTPGCLEYHLGCESKTRPWYLGISAEPISFIRNGCRRVLSAPRLTDH